MFLEIISPDKSIFSGNVKLVEVPGLQSPFTVLQNHDAIISTLEKGKVRVIDEKDVTHFFEIEGGFVEVINNIITVLAN